MKPKSTLRSFLFLCASAMASVPLHAATINLDLTTSNTDPIVLDAGANDFSFASFNIDYLIVAGGGTGGGVNNGPRTGGGGGAGGLLAGATSITGLQNITVGAGGSNAGTLSLTPSYANRGTNGGNSVAFGLTAIGGGAGGTNGTTAGASGGSGGGAGTSSGGSGSGGAGTVGQGNNGAAGAASPTRFGGGGGGAGGAASGSTGGAGSSSSITGTAVTYAAGGNGGLSGSVAGAAGAANTGNGGNGASGTGSSTATTGGNGGSGIVVASYAGTTQLLSGGTVTTAGINTIHTFNAGGTLDLHSATINGDISGDGGNLLWNKTGTLTLGGTNSYTGTTTINAGTLKLGANDVIPGTSNVSIGTATLDADTRTDTTIGTLDVTGAATINLGSGAALAFADSKLMDWTGGTLNITGTLGATSLRFGDSADDLDPSQLALISVNGGGLGTFALDANGYLFQPVAGPVDSFVISAISSPQTVGTPITGITITAKDSSNFTATGFTGTVTFGGTGGFSGSSGSFTAGVLSGVSVTPTVAGSNLTFTVDDGASHTGSTTIATINSNQTPYQIWATGGELFDDDANNDGVDNGLAFLLGASSPTAAVTPPTVTQNGGDLILNFNCLPDAARGNATLWVEHSSDLGVLDLWTPTANEVPDATNAVSDNDVTFVVDTVSEAPLNKITATIGSAAAAGNKLFGRLKAVETP